MKKYPKIVQCDGRGQIVIPKDMRQELGIEEGTGFWMFAITDEGLLLKKIEEPSLTPNHSIIRKIDEKADKIDIKRDKVLDSVDRYRRRGSGRLEEI